MWWTPRPSRTISSVHPPRVRGVKTPWPKTFPESINIFAGVCTLRRTERSFAVKTLFVLTTLLASLNRDLEQDGRRFFGLTILFRRNTGEICGNDLLDLVLQISVGAIRLVLGDDSRRFFFNGAVLSEFTDFFFIGSANIMICTCCCKSIVDFLKRNKAPANKKTLTHSKKCKLAVFSF